MKKIFSIQILLVFLFTLSACSLFPQSSEDTQENFQNSSKEKQVIQKVEASSFAVYNEDKLSYTKSLVPYKVLIDENTEISPNLFLTDETKEMLNKNAFAIFVDDYRDEYYEIYETNRYEQIPNFITTDSALHTYHLFFSFLLKDLESTKLSQALNEFSDKMIIASRKQLEELKGTFAESSAKRNMAYFVVGKKLIDPSYEIPSTVKEIVDKELNLISLSQGIEASNILGSNENPYFEDFSQYIARGHYTSSEELTKYFKSMMWYGRLSFRLSDISETTSALLIVSALNSNKDILALWEKIFEPINFFVGDPDDLSVYDYSSLGIDIFSSLSLKDIIKNGEQKIAEFIIKANLLKDPLINSMPIWAEFIDQKDRNEEIKGFRVFGQRSTIDAMIFQKLIYRDVLENKNGELRMLPRSIDIPAVFGSKEAEQLLRNFGDFSFANFEENFNKMKEIISSYSLNEWGKNLYSAWLYSLKSFTKEYEEGYPSFMMSENWKLKELISFLGSYTELKHDTVLYAKQVYAEMGGGPEMTDFDDRGFVEPNPELYNRLKSLTRMTIEGLSKRDLLSNENKESLKRLEEMMKILRDISIKQLENKVLTDEEYEFIRNYGGSLEHLFTDSLSEKDKNKDRRELLNGHPSSIITDIATNPNGEVLQVGVGPVSKIYVVFPQEGKLKLGVGGVYSHYEFPWPLSDRLTDEKWRNILFPYDPPTFEPLYDFSPEIHKWQEDFSITYSY